VALAGHGVAQSYGECLTLLSDLEESLKKLQTRLKEGAQWSSWEGGRIPINALEQSISLLQETRRSPLSLQVAGNGFIGVGLTTLLNQISHHCNLDPDHKIQTLISEILDKIGEQRDANDKAIRNQNDWDEAARKIRSQIKACSDHLDDASGELTSYLSSGLGGLSAIESIKHSLDLAAASLEQAYSLPLATRSAPVTTDSDRRSARETVASLIGLAKQSLREQIPAAFFPHNGIIWSLSGGGPRVLLDKSSLMGRVYGIVQEKPGYFSPSPGSFVQAVHCVALCLIIWANYPEDTPEEQALRAGLIRSTLEYDFLLRIKGDEASIAGLADALASACVPKAENRATQNGVRNG
jgi:hypothetical protein